MTRMHIDSKDKHYFSFKKEKITAFSAFFGLNFSFFFPRVILLFMRRHPSRKDERSYIFRKNLWQVTKYHRR